MTYCELETKNKKGVILVDSCKSSTAKDELVISLGIISDVTNTAVTVEITPQIAAKLAESILAASYECRRVNGDWK